MFNRLVKTILILFISFISIEGEARNYYFSHYNVGNGVSQNTIHKILQDRQGFMWFATKDGLNRFDGKNFRRVDVDPSLGNCSYISTLFEDSRGRIWVGTHKGPFVYNPETEQLQPLFLDPEEHKELNSTINVFAELPDGRILLGIDNEGICAYNPSDRTVTSLVNMVRDNFPSVISICPTPKGNIFIGTFGDGLYYTDRSFKKIRKVAGSDNMPYFNNCVVNVIKRDGDRIYIGTDNMGLHQMDETNGHINTVFLKDETGAIPYIRDISFNDENELLIGTETGVYVLDMKDQGIKSHLTHDYFYRYSISDDAIYSIYFDRDNGLWIGSYFGGIDYHGVNQPEFIKYVRKTGKGNLQAERIRELCQDRMGRIFIGSEDNGLSVLNLGNGSIHQVKEINAKNIHGLCLNGDELWIGTFSEGIMIYNISTGHVRRLTTGNTPGLTNDFVFSITKTADGYIYIGTFSGLQYYEPAENKFYDISDLKGLFIYNLREDKQGNLWVATYSNGLFMRPKGENRWINYLENKNDSKSLPSNKTYSVQEDSHGNIWVMTQNGACIYNHEGFNSEFLGIDRIPGVVYRMEEDDSGNYWLTSNNGLYCLDPLTGNLLNFKVNDGLPINQFNYNSSMKTADGRLYFGSIDGLVMFDPKTILQASRPIAPLIVSELYIHSKLMKPGDEGSPLSKSITLTDRLIVEPWQNSIGFNFSTLSYDHNGNGLLKYMLEGYDNNWKVIDLESEPVNYSNLSPGHYKLKGVAINPDGKELGEPYELAIEIKTPFYATWWAILIYFLLGIALSGFFYFYYKKYSRLSKERYFENYKHNQERELFDSKIKFFTNVAHEIRTPLTLIKAPLDTVFKHEGVIEDPEIKENLEVVNLNVDRLLQLTDQLLDFRKIESGNYKINRKESDFRKLVESVLMRFMPTIEVQGKQLETELPPGELKINIDPEAVTKIISNLVSNAIKYGDSYIKIKVSKTSEGGVKFKISNDGRILSSDEKEKIFTLFTRLDSDSPGTGIGLSYARSLAVMHGGTLTIENIQTENIFVLELPKGCEDKVDKSDVTDSDLEEIIKNGGDNAKVLIVEDNPELLTFLQKRLISKNYKVFTSMSGIDALKILNEQQIDIVVTDLMMPGMDGHELLQIIKDDIKFSHIPVIMLTAKTNMKDKLESLEAGADYYIEKPFSMEYLLVSIDSLLRNRNRVRHKIETNPLEKIPLKGLTKTDEEFLKKINEIITKNFNNPEFSVDNIIAEMGMGSTTFYRKVKGLLNLNPNQYIKIQRLKEAARLFGEGHTNVSEVCYKVGFSSPGYFAKCFYQQFGVHPKDYIKNKG